MRTIAAAAQTVLAAQRAFEAASPRRAWWGRALTGAAALGVAAALRDIPDTVDPVRSWPRPRPMPSRGASPRLTP